MKKILITSLYLLFGSVLLLSFVNAQIKNDWLKKTYQASHTVINEPYSSDIEAKDLFQDAIAIGGGAGAGDNVMVRFARFMMRFALIIGISMIIFIGIKVALSFGDTEKMKEALQLGGKVLLGGFLVLASVAIVYLISSLMRGSLQYEFFNSSNG